MRESWQTFQADFGRYLRDPKHEQLPENIIPRRAKVYEELLFNNIRGFINTCFPISKQLLGTVAWTELTRSFFKDWRCHSPRFNDIPKEFLDYLVSDISPEIDTPWLIQLAHYEWVELAVDTFDESGVESKKQGISVNPSLHNLIYDWPVHQISPDFLPTEPKPTFLLVFRNYKDKVSFTEINAATSALVNVFEQGYTIADDALIELSSLMRTPFNDGFKAFGLDMINQLIRQEVLVRTNLSA